MQRTQISLTAQERRLLDAEAARTGRSIAALIRAAVQTVYGGPSDRADDLLASRESAGTWRRRSQDGAAYVEEVRSGRRLRP